MSDNLNHAADEFKKAAQDAGEQVNKAAQQAADAAQEAAEEATAAAQEAGAKSADAAKSTVDDIVEGVERVSTQVADSARQFWESDQRKEVQDSVVKGLSGLASAIEEQTKKIAANPETQKVVNRIEEVADKVVVQVRSSKTIQDLAEGVMKGLTAVAASIESWLVSQKTESGEETTDIVPIEDARVEPPSVPPAPPVSFDDTQSVDIEKSE
jgi:hypothetical protein